MANKRNKDEQDVISAEPPAKAAKAGKCPPQGGTYTERYERFRKLVQAQPATPVDDFKGDANQWHHNARIGVLNLRPHVARLRKEMPGTDWDWALQAADVAAALVVASQHALSSAPVATRTEIEEHRTRLRRQRDPMLLIARGLALKGFLPLDRVEKIEADQGLIDSANDGLALVVLYGEHAPKIANKHPFTAADFAEAETEAQWILEHVVPVQGRDLPAGARPPAVDLRNRFAAEVKRRHEALRRGGYQIWGDDFDAQVPPLGARVLGPRAEVEEEEPVEDEEPAAPATPATPVAPPAPAAGAGDGGKPPAPETASGEQGKTTGKKSK